MVERIRDKLAENTHELWAMRKIDQGWIFGEVSRRRSSEFFNFPVPLQTLIQRLNGFGVTATWAKILRQSLTFVGLSTHIPFVCISIRGCRVI